MNFDWTDLAFADKKPLRKLQAIFIAAPREMSEARWKEIIKTYLPEGNLVVGVAKESYVDGLDGQPQFKMDDGELVTAMAARASKAAGKHQIATLHYFQRELPYVIQKLDFRKVVLVNGSWKHAFHTLPAFYELTKQHMPFEYISPFVSLDEAKVFEQYAVRQCHQLYPVPHGTFTDIEMLKHAATVAKFSFDHSFQTGAVLGKQIARGKKYELMLGTFNKIVPMQTYALHYGAARETHFSPPNDLNHYDTVHAETELIIEAQRQRVSLQNTTLFINLLPCPACARMLAETDIDEVVYRTDHSDGYAVKMLELAGKKVRRIVP